MWGSLRFTPSTSIYVNVGWWSVWCWKVEWHSWLLKNFHALWLNTATVLDPHGNQCNTYQFPNSTINIHYAADHSCIMHCIMSALVLQRLSCYTTQYWYNLRSRIVWQLLMTVHTSTPLFSRNTTMFTPYLITKGSWVEMLLLIFL